MFAIPLIGGVVSAVGTVMGAQATRKAGMYNAAVSKNNARTAQYEGELEAQDRRREMRQTLGAMRAAYGVSGIQFSGGSGLDVLRDTAVEYAWDEQKIRYKADVRAASEGNQADIYEAEAKNAMPAAIIGAGTWLLKGAAGSYSMWSSSTYGSELG